VINIPKFKHLPENIKEVWKIYEAWLYLLFKMGKIDYSFGEHTLFKRFKVSRFINEMNTFSKDKKGLNIPIIIVHTVLLIFQNKHELLYDRLGAISKYIYRYIHEKENQRSYYFIKMLLVIVKNDFQKREIIVKTKVYYSKLMKIPIDTSSQSHSLEIIPYEDVWDLILELLDKKGSISLYA